MNILVTGGAGYVGSHACKALARAGYTPVCYDNLSRGHEWAVQWGPLERGDIADGTRLRQVLRQYRPAAVLHFAGLIAVGESVTEPALYYANNVTGSLTLLDALRAEGVAALVFSSSAAVYGDAGAEAIPESAPMDPRSPYGLTKFLTERMLSDYGRAYGLRSVSLRYFNACGADADGQIGEAHEPETHLVPRVLAVAAGQAESIDVYGNDYPTPDGTCIRDYIHVSDLADAHVRALEWLVNGKQGADPNFSCNLGTGRGHSVLEVIEAARRMTGRAIPVVMRPRRAGDPPCAFADPTLARRELGWTPRHLGLDEILRSAWNWAQRSQPTA